MLEIILIVCGFLSVAAGVFLKVRGSNPIGNTRVQEKREETALSEAREEVEQVTTEEIKEILDERKADVDRYIDKPDTLAHDANDLIGRLRAGQSDKD